MDVTCKFPCASAVLITITLNAGMFVSIVMPKAQKISSTHFSCYSVFPSTTGYSVLSVLMPHMLGLVAM